MQTITKTTTADFGDNTHAESIDYSQTGKESIFGAGDKATLDFLEQHKPAGRWLDLAGGDGRYTRSLLSADQVYVGDIDQSALSKTWFNLNDLERAKISLSWFDCTKQFPFVDGYFDGVFCAGFIYLFPEETTLKILGEVARVLDSGSKFLFDFATDIKRVKADGSLVFDGDEPRYDKTSGLEMIKRMLAKDFTFGEIVESSAHDDSTNQPALGYDFSCNFFLVSAVKN